MAQSSENVTWLTQEAYERLSTELKYLLGDGRLEMARRIEAARDEGDLRENGGYHAAKEEQGKQEARIRQLQQLLEKARVGDSPPEAGVAVPGTVVSVRFTDGDEMTFLLGSREVASDELDVYSEQSPLGSAINGKKIGESATYALPNGRKLTVEIVEAKPFTG
ncbi:MAG TPA: transcription elongation factor GreA [Actinomycetes bacterium]|nr:transcription elongation factor GreA [Actinomycetes bacterium]